MIPHLDRSAALHSRATALQARAEPHRASPPNTLTFWLPPPPPPRFWIQHVNNDDISPAKGSRPVEASVFNDTDF